MEVAWSESVAIQQLENPPLSEGVLDAQQRICNWIG
jgi:hypothetical protein